MCTLQKGAMEAWLISTGVGVQEARIDCIEKGMLEWCVCVCFNYLFH